MQLSIIKKYIYLFCLGIVKNEKEKQLVNGGCGNKKSNKLQAIIGYLLAAQWQTCSVRVSSYNIKVEHILSVMNWNCLTHKAPLTAEQKDADMQRMEVVSKVGLMSFCVN